MAEYKWFPENLKKNLFTEELGGKPRYQVLSQLDDPEVLVGRDEGGVEPGDVTVDQLHPL